MHCYHHWYLSGCELSHVLLTSGNKQCCFEHYLLHWSGDLTGMSASHHHILLIVRVSKWKHFEKKSACRTTDYWKLCNWMSLMSLCTLYRKKLFEAVHNFVHLNLAIALFLGYLTFAVGVELATPNKVCTVVLCFHVVYPFVGNFQSMIIDYAALHLHPSCVYGNCSPLWWTNSLEFGG